MFLRSKKVVLACVMAGLMGATSYSQEISAPHMSAARKAIAATGATNSFDNILVGASGNIKNQLTANNPDQAERISNIVDEEAIALAPRRGALEAEAARLFANTFNESELEELQSFFSSPTGAKYLDSTPILARELSKSARVWANGITRDLSQNVEKRLAIPKE